MIEAPLAQRSCGAEVFQRNRHKTSRLTRGRFGESVEA